MKRRELTPQQVSSVRCPTCAAPVGRPCELLSGALRSEPHLDREFAAIEALETERNRIGVSVLSDPTVFRSDLQHGVANQNQYGTASQKQKAATPTKAAPIKKPIN